MLLDKKTNVRNEEEDIKKMAETLPDGLIPPPPNLISLVKNLREAQKFKEKAGSSEGSEKAKCQEFESRYLGFVLQNFKRAFNESDKKHLKMVLDLRALLQKIEKLEKFKGKC